MSESIVLFDGVCNLCNASVQFIIKRDPESKLKFASLQSDVGQSFLVNHKLSAKDFHSIILIQDNQVFQNSDAVLQIARLLTSPWPMFYYLGRIIPGFIRNRIYQWISKNRYRFFGRQNECMVPTPEVKSRFL